MSIFAWCTRRSGGLAMLGLAALCYWVVSKEAAASRFGFKYQQEAGANADAYPITVQGGGRWTVAFAYYCLFIHILVFLFPVRACYAMWDLTRSLGKIATTKSLRDVKFPHRRRDSSTSLSSSETLTSSRDACSATSSEAGDFEQDLYTEGDMEPERVIHAIVIPNYKEEIDSLRETLEVLGSHPQARNTYDVYLGMEQRESGADLKAMGLINEFSKKFRSMDFTLHPGDIPGEAAGKGSNVGWAARKLSEKYPMSQRKDVIVTGIDADSHLSSNFFALITSMHFAHPDTAATTLYSAPIIFDRNADKVPAIVRVADILWSAAGMSGLYRGSTISPPTSVYSLPLELVDRVGGWDTDAEAIGEDLHMYLKCFFALNGNLTNRTVLSPVSQSNVASSGPEQGFAAVASGMRARYKQALRHMWGALDSGYAIRQCVELWQERKHTTRAFQPLHCAQSDDNVRVTQDQLNNLDPEQPIESGIFANVTQDTIPGPNYQRLFYLAHRMFEAHFLPVQMTILVISSTLYVWVTEGTTDVHNIHWIFTVSNVLRTLGFMQIAFYLFLYENFHRICVQAREKEMGDAGLASDMHFSHRDWRKNLIDYVMVPLVAPLYGSIPCAQAQIQHFWTQDLVYAVSKKVTRQRAKSLTAAALA